jgi:hypothetical protein
LLSFIPALIIIPLAFGAAFTQWCFASALYRLISGRRWQGYVPCAPCDP